MPCTNWLNLLYLLFSGCVGGFGIFVVAFLFLFSSPISQIHLSLPLKCWTLSLSNQKEAIYHSVCKAEITSLLREIKSFRKTSRPKGALRQQFWEEPVLCRGQGLPPQGTQCCPEDQPASLGLAILTSACGFLGGAGLLEIRVSMLRLAQIPVGRLTPYPPHSIRKSSRLLQWLSIRKRSLIPPQTPHRTAEIPGHSISWLPAAQSLSLVFLSQIIK